MPGLTRNELLNGKVASAMATASRRNQAPGPDDGIPPLEPGDRLSRAEFERRYDAMPALKKAELIEGVVYWPSPVRLHPQAAEICAAAARSDRPVSQRGLPRPLARPGGADPR